MCNIHDICTHNSCYAFCLVLLIFCLIPRLSLAPTKKEKIFVGAREEPGNDFQIVNIAKFLMN